MEVLARFQAEERSAFRVYCDLQCRLMERYIARGGSAPEWCERLAPAFHRRWGWLLEEGPVRATRRTQVFRLGPTSAPLAGG